MKSKKIVRIVIILFLVLQLISCTSLVIEVGATGWITGKLVILPENLIGIDGIAEEDYVLFPKKQQVKWTLMQKQAANLQLQYDLKNGDSIDFWYVLDKVSNEEWGTIVGIGTDLILSSQPK